MVRIRSTEEILEEKMKRDMAELAKRFLPRRRFFREKEPAPTKANARSPIDAKREVYRRISSARSRTRVAVEMRNARRFKIT